MPLIRPSSKSKEPCSKPNLKIHRSIIHACSPRACRLSHRLLSVLLESSKLVLNAIAVGYLCLLQLPSSRLPAASDASFPLLMCSCFLFSFFNFSTDEVAGRIEDDGAKCGGRLLRCSGYFHRALADKPCMLVSLFGA